MFGIHLGEVLKAKKFDRRQELWANPKQNCPKKLMVFLPPFGET